MRSRRLPRIVSTASALTAAAGVVVGAEGQGAPQAAAGRLVHVEVFRQSGAQAELDYGRLLSGLVRLRLAEDPSVRLSATSATLRCPVQAPGAQGVAREGVSRDTPDYVVSGHLDVRPDGLRLEYSVRKCTDTGAVPLAQRATSFTHPEAFTEFSLVTYAVAKVLRDDAPRVPVVVDQLRATTPRAEGFALQVTRRIAAAIDESGDMQRARSGIATIAGTVEVRADSVRARIALRLAGDTVTLPALAGPVAESDAFAERVGSEVVAWLSLVRVREVVGESVGESATEALIASARRALCLDGPAPCGVDLGAALAASRAATQMDSTLATAWFLRGLAESGGGQWMTARSSLRRAHRLLDTERGTANEVAIVNALADAHFHLGDYSWAIEDYDRSLRLRADQPAVALARAEALWFNGERLQALRALMQLRRDTRAPADSNVLEHIGDYLETLEPWEVVSDTAVVATACRLTSELRQQCLDLLAVAHARLARADSSPGKIRAAVQLLLSLRPSDPEIVAGAYAQLATTYLGEFSNGLEIVVVGADTLEFVYPQARDFRADSMDRYLRLAEARSSDSLRDRTREWIVRLRALYHRNGFDFEAASPLADSAVRITGSEWAVLVAAELRYLRARRDEVAAARNARRLPASARQLYEEAERRFREAADSGWGWSYWYLREIYHALGRDRDGAAVLATYLARDSNDVQVLDALAFVYHEYLFDYARAFAIERRLLALSAAAEASDTVEAAEAALAAGEFHAAARWLVAVMARPDQDPLEPCYAMVAAFYLTWTAVGLGMQPSDINIAFTTWEDARARFWALERPQMCWVFRGVRNHLQRSQRESPRARATLLAMIDAMNRRDAPARAPAF